jgi:phage regulator Rha-like protein
LKWRSNDKSTQYPNIKEVIFEVTNWHLKFGGEMKALIPVEMIEQKILMIRGEKVMLDSDLAELYGVEVKQLKRQVRRNINRFPADFMIQLSKEEYESLRRHFGTLKRGEHSKYLPYAFTEQGVAMLSSVLNSERAVKVNIEIMRAFVKLRQMLASNTELARKLDAMEKKYDEQFKVVFDAIRQLMTPPETKKKKIGFRREKEN